MLESPDFAFAIGWDVNPLWEAIYLSEDSPLLQKIWRPQPTMIHPSHVHDLALEIQRLAARLTELDTAARDELAAASALCEDTASQGYWLISVGP